MSFKAILVFALCVGAAYCDVTNKVENKVEKLSGALLQERQKQLMNLFSNVHEPLSDKKLVEIATTWTLGDNLDQFDNITAAKTYDGMIKYKWYLPRAVPYAPYEASHNFETFTLFNVLYSAKTYETFYKTAVYLRDIVNEGLYVYVLSVAIYQRLDTQGITLPPIYEILPTYFNYGEVMNTAMKIDMMGKDFASTYPAVASMQENHALINAKETFWPYLDNVSPIKYFTNDYSLNSAYYYLNIIFPYWLGQKTIPEMAHDRRGEWWMFMHKQILARYYMERLSAGLGEIPEITNVVPEGYSSGLIYENGIPYPSRSENFHLDDAKLAVEMEQVKEFENRIWEAIDKGFYVDREGKHISLRHEDGIEVLATLIESNMDSPNSYYYKDYIRIWRMILGNSMRFGREYSNHFSHLVVPSALENYQTCLRDPAFYMIWKRVLRMFSYWQKQMPLYKPEDLATPGVAIEKVETDKLLTYFDKTYMNITNYMSDDFEGSVLVSYPRLNHKPFSVRVSVKSEAAKKVVVKFFLAPKYDSKGYEIPLHLNTENFFQLDEFVHELTAGENMINRKSTANYFAVDDWYSASDVYQKALMGQYAPEEKQSIDGFPQRLLLPKGHPQGMPFLLITYIQPYMEPALPDSEYISDAPLGYPANRPLHHFQVAALKNLKIQDVMIYHKE